MVIGVLAALLLILGPLGIATAFKLYKKYLYQRCLKALTGTYYIIGSMATVASVLMINSNLSSIMQQNQDNAQE